MSGLMGQINRWGRQLFWQFDVFGGGWRSDALLSFMARFGVFGANYLAIALISRAVSVADFGIVSFVLSTQLTVSLVIELGLGPMLTRYASFFLGAGEVERTYGVFKAALVIKVMVNTLVALAAFAIGPQLAAAVYGQEWIVALLSGVLLAVGTSFQSYFIGVYQSLGRFGLVLVALMLQYGGQLLVLIAIWVVGQMTMPAIIAAYGLGFALFGVASVPSYPWRKVATASVRTERLRWREYRKFWQWIALGNLAIGLALPINTLILASLYPADEVARYYSAFKVAQLFWIVEQVVGFVLLPWLSQRAGEGGPARVLSHVPRLLALVSGIGLVMALILALLAGPLIRLVYGDPYASAVPVLRALIPMGFGYLLCGAGTQVLVSLGKPAVSAWAACGAAVLNLLLNWLLTPLHGALGAAAAGSIAAVVQMFGIWLAVKSLTRGA
jgi:O-antigen/teichoic acid export membrane protein